MTERYYPIALVAVLFCGLLSPCAKPVLAQSDDAGLMLAKVFVNEAGMDAPDDHLAIANYSRRLARHRGVTMAVFLPSRLRRALAGASARVNRVWIANLDRSGNAPIGWDESRQPWSARRGQWLATLERADAFLRGEIDARDGCRPTSWGSPVWDREELDRAFARGAVAQACGDVKNVFYRFGGAR